MHGSGASAKKTADFARDAIENIFDFTRKNKVTFST